jgi:microcystin-dependent protein
MGSYFRDYYSPTATQRPTVGDTKFSVINQDHMGWLKCDGRALPKITYNILYQVIGGAFGESSSEFNLPNMAGRVPGAIGSNASTINNWALGNSNGADWHTLTINEMPAHTHGSVPVSGNSNGNGFTDLSGVHFHTGQTNNDGYAETPATASDADILRHNVADDNVAGHSHTFTTSNAGLHQHQIYNTGGSNLHNNMQPTLFIGNMYIFSGKVRPTASNYYPYATGSNINIF